MKVKDLMTMEVITVGRESSLKEAARRMIEAGISGLVVTDTQGDIEGVITEADFVKTESGRRAVKRARLLRWMGGGDPEISTTQRRVEDVMTKGVITIGPGADHADAARLMRKAGVKRIPVVDEKNRLLGIVSRSDIMRAFARPDASIVDEIVNHVMGDILWIDSRTVTVNSTEGNVVLHGQLETRSDATLLEELSRRVDGVVSVVSHLAWSVDNTELEMVPPPPQLRGPIWP